MKLRKKVLLIICLIVLFISSWFFYRLATLPTYRDDGKTIIYKNNVYVPKDYNFTDTDKIGKVIGIVIYGNKKRTLSDFIFGATVRELKNDREHNLIYIRWLMGPDVVYEKVSK